MRLQQLEEAPARLVTPDHAADECAAAKGADVFEHWLPRRAADSRAYIHDRYRRFGRYS